MTAMDITPADDYDDDNDNEKQGAESSPLIRPRMTPDALATISATCQLFAHIGRQFCANNDSSDQASGSSNRFGSGFSFPEGASTSNNSSGFEGSRRLEGCLRLRTKLFFAESHAKQLAHAKALAARDTWARGPYLALPPPPHETPHYGKKAHHNSSHSSHSSSKVEAWNTGLNASDVLSTVRVLTAETPGPSGGSSGSNSGSSGATDSSNSEANNGRAFLPWACSARQHAAVRRLVTSKRSQTPWPPIAERLPAVRFRMFLNIFVETFLEGMRTRSMKVIPQVGYSIEWSLLMSMCLDRMPPQHALSFPKAASVAASPHPCSRAPVANGSLADI